MYLFAFAASASLPIDDVGGAPAHDVRDDGKDLIDFSVHIHGVQ